MQPTADSVESIARRGIAALQQGDFKTAQAALGEAARSDGATPQLWLLLAQACEGNGDQATAHQALDKVLEADQRNPFALLMKGDLFARAGDDRAAVSFYRLGLGAASRVAGTPGDLAARVERASAAVAAAEQRFQSHLQTELAAAGITRLPPRFEEALEIASGATEVYLQQPTSFYYPGLPQTAWFDAADFPWAAEFEAAAADMRAEVEAVLAEDSGLVPYVERPTGRASRGHSLLDDSRWSAFHLWRDGETVEENARRCPLTMRLLERAPMPRIRARSPMALISVLHPGTHIPPHTGLLNTRLICHIPLVVPSGCRLRVGSRTRTVEPGKAMIFDDSIEHEAWNDGDSVRAVLLFEIWRPELDGDERAALTAMFESIGNYPGAS